MQSYNYDLKGQTWQNEEICRQTRPMLPNTVEHSQSRLNAAKQGQMGPNRVKRDLLRPNGAKQYQIRPNGIKQGQTGPISCTCFYSKISTKRGNILGKKTMILHRNVSDDGYVFQETKLSMYSTKGNYGVVTKSDISNVKQLIFAERTCIGSC